MRALAEHPPDTAPKEGADRREERLSLRLTEAPTAGPKSDAAPVRDGWTAAILGFGGDERPSFTPS